MIDSSKLPRRRGAPVDALAWLLAGTLLLTTAQAQTPDDSFDVGGVSVHVPALQGFTEVSKRSPEIVDLAQAMIPPANRLLGVYLSNADYEKLANGEAPGFDRYVFVQVNRELEDVNISSSDFREISAQLRAQQDTILHDVAERAGRQLDRATRKISQDYDVSLDMRFGEQRSLGVFLDRPNAIAFTSLVKYQGNLEGEVIGYVMAGSTMLIKVKRRLLYIYVYSQHQARADVDWVESRTTELADALLASDDSSADDGPFGGTLLSGLDFGGAVNGGIIGAIVAAFVTLMFVLSAGSRRQADKTDGDT